MYNICFMRGLFEENCDVRLIGVAEHSKPPPMGYPIFSSKSFCILYPLDVHVPPI